MSCFFFWGGGGGPGGGGGGGGVQRCIFPIDVARNPGRFAPDPVRPLDVSAQVVSPP